MHRIHFDYGRDNPTIENIVSQAVGYGSVCWTNVGGAGVFLSEFASEAVTEASDEIRRVLHTKLVALLDMDGVAKEWNSAIERVLEIVEELRP